MSITNKYENSETPIKQYTNDKLKENFLKELKIKQRLMPVFFSPQNGFLLDVSSIIYADRTFCFNDSRYVILIVRKQYATSNLLLSI